MYRLLHILVSDSARPSALWSLLPSVFLGVPLALNLGTAAVVASRFPPREFGIVLCILSAVQIMALLHEWEATLRLTTLVVAVTYALQTYAALTLPNAALGAVADNAALALMSGWVATRYRQGIPAGTDA